jgi:phosphopantothenate-cysteine ligase
MILLTVTDLGKLRTCWCPRAYSVTFKLEDDTVLLSERAHRQMERLGAHLVVGNVVTTRRK